MDYELLLKLIDKSIDGYVEMTDRMLEKADTQLSTSLLEFQRVAYMNIKDEIKALKTTLVRHGIEAYQKELEKLEGERK